mmetsp:Transcript_13123/g.37759  ORF Transcript_13123/g.37759 Transcript_13123/m.37759 type:complete len:145 (+) Transcript_13123:65-499(+)
MLGQGAQCDVQSAIATAFGSVPLSDLTAAASGASGLSGPALTLENLSLHNSLLYATPPGGSFLDRIMGRSGGGGMGAPDLEALRPPPAPLGASCGQDASAPVLLPLTEENLHFHNMGFVAEVDELPTSASYYLSAGNIDAQEKV